MSPEFAITAGTRPALEGQQWEDFCGVALEYRHRAGPQFQKVPARFRGDWGIDGFVREASLFQCFGDESGTSYKQRSDAQQDKLDRDIPKLKKNAVPIGEMVGTGVGNYLFLVSELQDKDVVLAAGTWTQTVRGWGLPYLSERFEIVVKDIDFFKAEWDLFHGSVNPNLDLGLAKPAPEEIDAWKGEQTPLLANLDGKLDRIAPGHKSTWIDTLVRYRVAQLDRMKALESHPEIWQRVRAVDAAREETVPLRGAASDPHADVQELAEVHRADLSREVSSLSQEDTTALAWGSVADWLMRCPLNYGSDAS